MVALRLSWHISDRSNRTNGFTELAGREGHKSTPPPGTFALLALDNHLNQPASVAHVGKGCAASGAALICASLCEGLPSNNQQLHARLKSSSSFTFSGFSAGACLKLGGAAALELPVQDAVDID